MAGDVTLQHRVPHSLEAERGVLGAILLDNRAFHLASEILESGDFFVGSHCRIFFRMARLSEKNRAIDLITLNEELEGTGELENAGGTAYLGSLVDGVPRVSNVEYYAQIVKQKARLRNLIHASHNIINQAFAGDVEAEAIARQAIENFARIVPGPTARLGVATPAAWPEPPAEAVFFGLAGDIVRAVEPHSEADPVALLFQTLVAFGNIVGRGPHFIAESDVHATNLYTVLVGATSKGRKGSSWAQVRNVFEPVQPLWAGERVQSGLSSGEGLIWAVRDPIEQRTPIRQNGRVVDYEFVIVDPGMEDKRLLAFESEFCAPLRLMARDGNILSAVLRQAWDSGRLRTITKTSPARATGAHISVIGHATKEELLRYLNSTEAAAGFANRFLWVCVRRSKFLPEGGRVDEVDLQRLIQRVQAAVDFARTVGMMRRDEAAREIWRRVYPHLSEGRSGLLGAVLARAEAQVMRLAMVYALLDLSVSIRREHLRAALALWDYVDASARFIFGDAFGDPLAEEVLKALRDSPSGLTRTEISSHFARHRSSRDIGQVLRLLQATGLVRQVVEETGGRPAERWIAILPGAKQAKNAKNFSGSDDSSHSSHISQAHEPMFEE